MFGWGFFVGPAYSVHSFIIFFGQVMHPHMQSLIFLLVASSSWYSCSVWTVSLDIRTLPLRSCAHWLQNRFMLKLGWARQRLSHDQNAFKPEALWVYSTQGTQGNVELHKTPAKDCKHSRRLTLERKWECITLASRHHPARKVYIWACFILACILQTQLARIHA